MYNSGLLNYAKSAKDFNILLKIGTQLPVLLHSLIAMMQKKSSAASLRLNKLYGTRRYMAI